jgi:hypothetical protein
MNRATLSRASLHRAATALGSILALAAIVGAGSKWW